MRVKFFPKTSTIPVSICDHRYDAQMTFSEQTDSRILPSIYVVEAYGFKNNVRLGAFQSNIVNQTDEGIAEEEDTGLIRHDVYFGTDRWKNPVTGAVEQIPDYYSDAWTSAGQQYFDVVIGAIKPTRYPNCGQDMYDVSNGEYGYNFISGTSGNSNLSEFIGVVDIQQDWLKSLTGRRGISALSYRNGREETAELQYPYYLGGRNSTAGPAKANGDAQTYYGISKDAGGELGFRGTQPTGREYFISYQSTSRFWDWQKIFYAEPMTHEEVNAYIIQELGKCTVAKGWFRDFTHWHSAYADESMPLIDEFLALVKANTGFIHTCSNGEALEYLFIRELASRVRANEKNGKIYITIDVVDKYKSDVLNGISQAVKMTSLNTPLSVRVDLSGTSLAGQDVISNTGRIKSNGSNVYIVEVPFDLDQDGFITAVIEPGVSNYLDFSTPIITNSIIGNSIRVETNQNVKCVLFEAPLGGGLEDIEDVERSNELDDKHYFSFDSNKEQWIGAINETGQSSLIKI